MKSSIKLIALLMLAFMVLSLFGACGKKDDAATSSTDDNALSTADINFIDADGEATYRVIRPENSNESETAGAILVFKEYKGIHGVDIKNQTDEEEANAAEILIGNTNREETAKAKELLDAGAPGRDNEYIICSINDDIVIYGRSDAALTEAINYFVNNYLANATVSGGINYVYQSAEGYQTVGIFGDINLSKLTVVRPIYNVSYIVQTEIDALIEAVAQKTGYRFELVNDQDATVTGDPFSGKSELVATADNDYEIIVGSCVRNGVKKFDDKEEYEIRIEDKNIYLNGGSPKAIAMAVTEFASMLKSKAEVTTADSVLSGDYDDVIDKYDSASYYRLTWSDDFEGTEINESVWNIRWGEKAYEAPPGGKNAYRGNKDLKNNYVKDGKLYIDALVTDDAYYGGMLTTQRMMQYYFGYIEISTLHPRCSGVWTSLYTMSAVSKTDTQNVWSWLHNDDRTSRMYYSETDLEECYGPGNYVYQNSFAWATEYGREALGMTPDMMGVVNVHNTFNSDDRGFWMDFHTFGYEWNDNKSITYTVDGVAWLTQELREGAEQEAYDQPVFLRLGMAAGTEKADKKHGISTNPEDWEKYSSYIVDYIHIYQHKGNILYTKNYTDINWNAYVVE